MFLKNILKISNWKNKFHHNQLSFLKEYMRATLINLPFQNLKYIKYPNEERIIHKPIVEDIVKSNLAGSGGVCADLTYFGYITLSSIGYQVDLICGSFVRTVIPNSHMLLVVTIPENKTESKIPEKYIIDMGCGSGLSEPIPLSKLPFSGKAGGFNFQYNWNKNMNNNNKIVSLKNLDGDLFLGKYNSSKTGSSPQDYDIYLEPINFYENQGAYIDILTNFDHPFNLVPYAFRFLCFKENDFELVLIKGNELILVSKERRVVEKFEDFYDIIPAYYHYFPMIPRQDIDLSAKYATENRIRMLNKKAGQIKISNYTGRSAESVKFG